MKKPPTSLLIEWISQDQLTTSTGRMMAGNRKISPSGIKSCSTDLEVGSRYLSWFWKFYGIDFNTDDDDDDLSGSRNGKKLVLGLIWTVLVIIQLVLIMLEAGITIQTIMLEEMEMLFLMIPLLTHFMYAFWIIIFMKLRLQKFIELFRAIIQTLEISFCTTSDDVRGKMRCWEKKVVAVFIFIYFIDGFVKGPLMFLHKDDPLVLHMHNITTAAHGNLHLDKTTMLIGNFFSTHTAMAEFLMATTFLIYTLLIKHAFHFLNHDIDKAQPKDLEDLCFQHQKLSVLIQSINDVFGSFLSSALVIQIFNVCFWTRGMALDAPWMTTFYHIVVLHILFKYIAFFYLLCWASITLNDKVFHLHKILFYRKDFRSDEMKNVKLDILFYLMNVTTHPAQISINNYFVINKGFVVTILGTVTTYTVALFGLN